VEVKEKEDLAEAIDFAKKNRLHTFVLGGGTDVLVGDEGFKGLVIKLVNKKVGFEELKNNAVLVTSGSGLVWDELIEKSVARKLQGIECLSGIPGSVGAAPIQNIGAYGQELKDVFYKLTAFDIVKNMFVDFNKEQCKLGYRDSIFKHHKHRYIVWDVSLRLYKNKKPSVSYDSLKAYIESQKIKNLTLKSVRKAVLAVRKLKLEDPSINPNAGSFFKNPIITKAKLKELKNKYPEIPNFEVDRTHVKVFAGWLIEQAELKGHKIGDAAVSDKNALVIINLGRAKARDVLELNKFIKKSIYQKFGIKLTEEVRIIDKEYD
jgi:UDP-N-acetylmuramate dehydrogenase